MGTLTCDVSSKGGGGFSRAVGLVVVVAAKMVAGSVDGDGWGVEEEEEKENEDE